MTDHAEARPTFATTERQTPRGVLAEAAYIPMEEAIVVGRRETGELYVLSSDPDLLATHTLLTKAIAEIERLGEAESA